MPAHNPETIADLLAMWSAICMRMNMHDILTFAKDQGLTLTQTDVMHLIFQEDGCDLTTICHHLAISRSAASQLVERLYREGLVTREDDPADRRSKIVRLTVKGEDLVTRHQDLRRAWLTDLATRLDHEDYDCVARTLTMLTDAAQALNTETDL